ncbi:hypothetical protein B0H10DRAFT_1945035 [Mycena sp. CBHHK59/15]|nr:hypothetical protein B0H10DRAFT_1945035 [Mycena sp. CBHHK59/15]
MSTSINNIIAVKALNRSDTQYTFSEFAGLLNERPNLRSRRATRQLLALVSQPPSLYVTPHNAAARVHIVMANPTLKYCASFRILGLWSDSLFDTEFSHRSDVEKIIARQVSPSDGLGFIYAYTSKSQRSRRRAPAAFIRQRGGRRARYRRAYKIGRTNNILRRKAEWRKQCGGRQEWKMSWLVPFAAKMEAILHMHYKRIKPAWLTPVPCAGCGVKHCEKFCMTTIGPVQNIDRILSHYCARLGWQYTSTRLIMQSSGTGAMVVFQTGTSIAKVDKLQAKTPRCGRIRRARSPGDKETARKAKGVPYRGPADLEAYIDPPKR